MTVLHILYTAPALFLNPKNNASAEKPFAIRIKSGFLDILKLLIFSAPLPHQEDEVFIMINHKLIISLIQFYLNYNSGRNLCQEICKKFCIKH